MIIKNGFICDATQYKKADIKIKNGLIDKIDNNLQSDSDEIFDAANLVVMPMMADYGVFVDDDKLSTKAVKKLAQDAKNSGFGLIGIESNNKIIDNDDIVELINNTNVKNIDSVAIVSSLTQENKLSNISKLTNLNTNFISLKANNDANTIRRIFEYSNLLDLWVICYPYDMSLVDSGVVNESINSSNLGLKSIPKMAESSELAKILEIARDTKPNLIIANISTYRSLELVWLAKQDGLNVKSQISLHHLLLNDNKIQGFNVYAKIFPPLREESQREKLLNALLDKKIDFIGSMHSKFNYMYKDLTFDDASFGIESLSDFLPILIDNFVKTKLITLSELSRLISFNPLLGIKNNDFGLIEVGKKAKLMAIDLDKKHKTQISHSLYKKEHFGKIVKIF